MKTRKQQSLLGYIFLFVAVLWLSAQGVTAQRPYVNPAVKKEAERRAAANKILDATVTKVDLQISKIPYMTSTFMKYRTATVMLAENGGGPFLIKQKLTSNAQKAIRMKNGPFAETYALSPDPTTTYRSLLENGLSVKIDLTDRKDDFKYQCDVLLIFYFSNGSKEAISLQGLTVVSNKEGAFKSGGNDLHISKNLPGNSFSDPNNAVVIPVVK